MSWLHASVGFGLLGLGVAACGPAAGSGDDRQSADVSALASSTRVYLVPVDARARQLCRDQINRYYCDVAAAEDAAADCLAQLPPAGAGDACAAGVEGCLRYETVDAPCAGGSQEIYPTTASCEQPMRNNCAFYSACLDRNVPCGEDGYALGYGEKYCTAFKNARLSPRGEAWVESVMYCLQEALVPYATSADQEVACDAIQQYAFDSHPGCYTQPSNSICYLPPPDVLTVMSTIGGGELLTAHTLKQIKTVIGTCIRDIGLKIFHGGDSAQDTPSPAEARRLSPSPAAEALDAEDLTRQYELWQELDRQVSTGTLR